MDNYLTGSHYLPLAGGLVYCSCKGNRFGSSKHYPNPKCKDCKGRGYYMPKESQPSPNDKEEE